MKIKNYEVVDHGIEHEQYFQGCGVSFTPFEKVSTGMGMSPKDALDDCLEQMAEGADIIDSGELDRIEKEILSNNFVANYLTNEEEDSDYHYFLSIRFNLE